MDMKKEKPDVPMGSDSLETTMKLESIAGKMYATVLYEGKKYAFLPPQINAQPFTKENEERNEKVPDFGEELTGETARNQVVFTVYEVVTPASRISKILAGQTARNKVVFTLDEVVPSEGRISKILPTEKVGDQRVETHDAYKMITSDSCCAAVLNKFSDFKKSESDERLKILPETLQNVMKKYIECREQAIKDSEFEPIAKARSISLVVDEYQKISETLAEIYTSYKVFQKLKQGTNFNEANFDEDFSERMKSLLETDLDSANPEASLSVMNFEKQYNNLADIIKSIAGENEGHSKEIEANLLSSVQEHITALKDQYARLKSRSEIVDEVLLIQPVLSDKALIRSVQVTEEMDASEIEDNREDECDESDWASVSTEEHADPTDGQLEKQSQSDPYEGRTSFTEMSTGKPVAVPEGTNTDSHVTQPLVTHAEIPADGYSRRAHNDAQEFISRLFQKGTDGIELGPDNQRVQYSILDTQFSLNNFLGAAEADLRVRFGKNQPHFDAYKAAFAEAFTRYYQELHKHMKSHSSVSEQQGKTYYVVTRPVPDAVRVKDEFEFSFEKNPQKENIAVIDREIKEMVSAYQTAFFILESMNSDKELAKERYGALKKEFEEDIGRLLNERAACINTLSDELKKEIPQAPTYHVIVSDQRVLEVRAPDTNEEKKKYLHEKDLKWEESYLKQILSLQTILNCLRMLTRVLQRYVSALTSPHHRQMNRKNAEVNRKQVKLTRLRERLPHSSLMKPENATQVEKDRTQVFLPHR